MSYRLPPSAHIGVVTLRVGSIDDVLPFYRDVIGLVVHDVSSESATLGVGGPPLLRLVADPGAPPRSDRAAGLFHVAIRVPDRGALADALDRIHEGTTLTGASDHLVSEALYLSDPEDNGVEVYCDRPRTEWRTTPDGRVVMDTLPLDQRDLLESATGADRLPTGTDIGHIHLEVSDLDRAVAFYRDALGMTIQDDRWNGAAFLAAGDYHHHVGLNTWHGRNDPVGDSRGLVSFAVILPDAESSAGLEQSLTADSHSIDRTGEESTVTDPDGIRIVLQRGIADK